MGTSAIQAGINCIRSRPLDPPKLHDLAGGWHKRGEDSVSDALIQPDQETVMMRGFCLRPDKVHCFTTVGIFTPDISADYEARGIMSGPDAFAYAFPFFQWLRENESTGELDRWSAIFYMAESQEGLDSGDNTVFQCEWNKGRRANGSGRALKIRVGEKSRLADNRLDRASFFEQCLESLNLSKSISVDTVSDRLVFKGEQPWGVYPKVDDWPPEDIKMMNVFPFDEVSSLAEGASKLLGAAQHRVFRIVLTVEALTEVHNRICHTLPVEYIGWQMNCFGAPSEALQAWFAGDLNARPPGRIPIGRGWEGDPNLGFPYSVSVVETPEGPCIELGSDTATHEQLQQCSRYFDGLTFHPV